MLSPAQIKVLQCQLWPDAARAQGWPRTEGEAREQGFASVRAFRLERLSEIVGRPLKSSNELGKVDEFTQVKNRLLLLADNLRGAAEDGDAVPNALRTRRWVALRDIQCLRLYVEDGYVRELLKQRFARGGTCPSVFDELPLAEIVAEFKEMGVLTQLNYTLAARLQTHRKAACESLHELRTRAEVQCDCKACASGGKQPPAVSEPQGEPEPVHADDPY